MCMRIVLARLCMLSTVSSSSVLQLCTLCLLGRAKTSEGFFFATNIVMIKA